MTFAAYTLINDDDIEFNSSNVFSALALFNQLTVPLFIFPITIPIIISCLISTRRIERFLSQPEIEKEFEGIRNMARILCRSREELDDEQQPEDVDKKQISNKLYAPDTIDEEELDEKLLMEIKINDRDAKNLAANDFVAGDDGIEGVNKSVANDMNDDSVVLRNKNDKIKLRKQNQLSTSTRLERNRLRATTAVDKHNIADGPKIMKASPPFKVPDELIVCIKDARFSWDAKDDTNDLLVDNLSIPKGKVDSKSDIDELIGKLRSLQRSLDGDCGPERKRKILDCRCFVEGNAN